MRNKSLFLLLACVCGTVAAIGVSQWMSASQGGPNESVEIFVTTQAIGEQEEITPDKISLEQWPADKVPAGATTDLSALEGRFAKQAFYAGEPVLEAKLMNEKTDVIVPQGYRVVSMDTSRNSGIANLVKQGDRVDIDAYFTKSDLFPETKNLTILSGVRVFAIDGKTRRDPEETNVKPARSISLLIRKADSEAWIVARKNAEVSISLGSPGTGYESDDADTVPSEAGAGFLQWLADHKTAVQLKKRAEAARRAAEAEAIESGEIVPRSRKGVFRTTKMVGGRMIIYEWTPGSLVPTIIADTGTGQLEPDDMMLEGEDSSDSDEQMTDEDAKLSELNGDESPFYTQEK